MLIIIITGSIQTEAIITQETLRDKYEEVRVMNDKDSWMGAGCITNFDNNNKQQDLDAANDHQIS